MSFRTIVIKNRVKLEYSLNYLVCRGEQETRINLDEISLVIIQNIACAITVALMSKFIEKKIGVIICDEYHNPQFQLMPFHQSFDSYAKIVKQFRWSIENKNLLWKEIIAQKILNQADNLKAKDSTSYNLLISYFGEITIGDTTNREGHAAKVYFNSLFGKNFSRKDDNNAINKYLNYGYSILLSAINREIASFGYLTQLGIHHIGESNPFNLSCDFIEPLRPFVDREVITNENINDANFKDVLVAILTKKFVFDDKQMYLENAIHLYVQNLLSLLDVYDVKKLKFIKYGS